MGLDGDLAAGPFLHGLRPGCIALRGEGLGVDAGILVVQGDRLNIFKGGDVLLLARARLDTCAPGTIRVAAGGVQTASARGQPQRCHGEHGQRAGKIFA